MHYVTLEIPQCSTLSNNNVDVRTASEEFDTKKLVTAQLSEAARKSHREKQCDKSYRDIP